MRTAIDSNILLDVLKPDPAFESASREALKLGSAEGALVVGEVVWAEVGGRFDTAAACARVFAFLGVELLPSSQESAHAAGRAWRQYRRRGGRRERVVSDFLVGAHALHHADRLLTRDRGYYRAYFPRLKIWEPGKSH